MAFWQQDYFLFPKSKLIAHYGKVPKKFTIKDLDGTRWWLDLPPPDTTEIEGFLPRVDSRYHLLDMWGENSKNSFQIFYKKDRKQIESVGVRFDLRTEHLVLAEFTRKFVAFASRNDLVFLSCETSTLLPPTYKMIAASLFLSEAQSHVIDPTSEIIEERIRNGGVEELLPVLRLPFQEEDLQE